MKKLFALLMVTGSFAMFSCGGGEKKEEAAVDTTATEMNEGALPPDTTTAAPDTSKVAPDTTAHTDGAHQ
jgi:hypothetical protein